MKRCKCTIIEHENHHDTECDNAHYFSDGNVKKNKYKFCPFCGSKAKRTCVVNGENVGAETYCTGDSSEGKDCPIAGKYMSISVWNTRAQDSILEEIEREIKESIKEHISLPIDRRLMEIAIEVILDKHNTEEGL